MRMMAARLHKGDDLKKAIEQFVAKNNISAASVISAVGCVDKARIRMAGAVPGKEEIKEYSEMMEIVSLIGNLGPGRTHLHISLSRADGSVIGGHLKEGTVVDFVVELVLAVSDDLLFEEKADPNTGYDELNIRPV